MGINISFIKTLKKPFKFYKKTIKEFMILELKKILEYKDQDIKITILDSLPLLNADEVYKLIKIASKGNKNIILKHKNKYVGKIDISSPDFIEYESNNFEVLDSNQNYIRLFEEFNDRIIEKHIKNGIVFVSKKTTSFLSNAFKKGAVLSWSALRRLFSKTALLLKKNETKEKTPDDSTKQIENK